MVQISKRQLWIYGIGLGLVLILMYALRQCVTGDNKPVATEDIVRDYSDIREEGTLRLIAPYHLARLDSLDPSNVATLLQKLGARSGLKLNLEFEDNTQRALDKLRAGAVDLVLEPVALTSELDSSLFASVGEYVSSPLYLVQRADSTKLIKKQLELEGKTITLPRESLSQLFVGHLADELGVAVATKEDSLYNTEQLIMKVRAGSIDYTLCSAEERKYYEASFPELDFSLPLSHSLRRGWICRRSSPALIDSLRSWLK